MSGFPRMMRIRQQFDATAVDDVAGLVNSELSRLNLSSRISPGETVAISAGSRGISNIAVIVRAIADHVAGIGASPLVVPAMGSHGGATAEGQLKVLAGYGITEAEMGCPVRATMETVVVGETPQGIPVHFDRFAHEADHVIVCNRVKPHTGFVGPIESGLHKMMLIGLGNHNGAKIYHQAIADLSFEEIIRAVGRSVIETCGVLCGVAIVENAYDETGHIEAVEPENFFERECELLQLSKKWLPTLPFPDVDLLIVDRIGKNISGTGMDTNVVGRKFNEHAATERDDVRCRRILIRGLTAETYGNATGIGMAEFTTQSCVDSVNREATNVNAITGNHPEAGMIPLVYPTDAASITAALSTVGMVAPANARVIQIADTLHVAECLVSEVWAGDCARREDIEVLSDPEPMQFDDAGALADV